MHIRIERIVCAFVFILIIRNRYNIANIKKK